jgi:uridine kinase
LARNIYKALQEDENVAYLVHDSYYKDISHLSLEERAKTNFDHPDSLDTHLLTQHIQNLKKGLAVEVPHYDFSTHMRTKDTTVLMPKKIVLVEGILIFSEPELVKELDIKVFVDADADVRLIRRLSRDMVERGRTTHQVLDQYSNTVRPMHEAYVNPSKRVADIIVHSHHGDNSDTAMNMIVNHLKVEAGLI